MRLLTAVVAVAVCLGIGSSAAVGKSKRSRKQHRHEKRSKPSDPQAEGRAHLKKANALAGEGDCEAAIEEYTAAYENLDDPVVLFNRAECYRRTGAGEKAVADYRAFLDKVPQARNRADVEAKIASLASATSPTLEPEPSKSKQPPQSKQPPAMVAAPDAPPEPIAPPAPAVVVQRPAEADDLTLAPAEGVKRWWPWGVLAVLAAGGAAAGVVMFWPSQSGPPDSTWGNFRF